MIEITSKKIDREKVLGAVAHLEGGAICSFIGTVRSKTGNKKVLRLEYECYEPMAIQEIQKIIDLAKVKWPVLAVAVSHRVGTLQLGDEAVVLAVSTPHRKESFEACQFMIDTLKQTVPIWKKEIFEGGEEWVSAHP
ncbi:MAG: molybdenum cofactor biosynthesis protein MoaE [Bacteroidota bacterium]|jgi:molybdopterin synthase catalytic subunit|nr:molybdenum cofactor biosynthesis protein MoaE [Cytophagales bacterium]MCE2958408.1 molybdenum cofactor biosynthesis protein MoaE [Flammeovirgaceae bacterium]MCZ8071669.1 molybdenum cofactor biosynthesis protein MoaE [Cytophagales bacterium]